MVTSSSVYVIRLRHKVPQMAALIASDISRSKLRGWGQALMGRATSVFEAKFGNKFSDNLQGNLIFDVALSGATDISCGRFLTHCMAHG